MPTLTSTNPYTGQSNATFETLTRDELESKIQAAHQAFLAWKQTSFAQRKALMYQLAAVIESDLENFARLQTLEMGMLIGPSIKGLQGTGALIKWFADHAEEYLGAEQYELNGTTGKYLYDPLGVIYGIGPWNFPYNQILRAAIPNIMAGNTQVYKHASNVPMCAKQIEDWFRQAGFPEGVYSNIFISSTDSEYIIAHPLVRGVNLTGSGPAGSVVGALAGKYLKPSVLELGGNDAFVLLHHSDTQKMVQEATACRIANGGQKCNSSKRFIVLQEHYESFVEAMGNYMKSLKIGDPLGTTTEL